MFVSNSVGPPGRSGVSGLNGRKKPCTKCVGLGKSELVFRSAFAWFINSNPARIFGSAIRGALIERPSVRRFVRWCGWILGASRPLLLPGHGAECGICGLSTLRELFEFLVRNLIHLRRLEIRFLCHLLATCLRGTESGYGW